eukprot:SAG22_NODE_475_length_10003_cov_3.943356_4_plen_168_part_00
MPSSADRSPDARSQETGDTQGSGQPHSPPWPPVSTTEVNSDTFDPSELGGHESWAKISSGGYANVFAARMLGQIGELHIVASASLSQPSLCMGAASASCMVRDARAWTRADKLASSVPSTVAVKEASDRKETGSLSLIREIRYLCVLGKHGLCTLAGSFLSCRMPDV